MLCQDTSAWAWINPLFGLTLRAGGDSQLALHGRTSGDQRKEMPYPTSALWSLPAPIPCSSCSLVLQAGAVSLLVSQESHWLLSWFSACFGAGGDSLLPSGAICCPTALPATGPWAPRGALRRASLCRVTPFSPPVHVAGHQPSQT